MIYSTRGRRYGYPMINCLVFYGRVPIAGRNWEDCVGLAAVSSHPNPYLGGVLTVLVSRFACFSRRRYGRDTLCSGPGRHQVR